METRRRGRGGGHTRSVRNRRSKRLNRTMAPEPTVPTTSPRDRLYDEAAAAFGAALIRLARASEKDRHRQEDLLQDIHLALWRSFARFDGACALGTWVYRIAHNTVASHVLKDRRRAARQFVSLDVLAAGDEPAHPDDSEEAARATVKQAFEAQEPFVVLVDNLDRVTS